MAGRIRDCFSLSTGIKKRFNERARKCLCWDLSLYFDEALDRWPDDPLVVELLGHTFLLSNNPLPRKRGKVLVRMPVPK